MTTDSALAQRSCNAGVLAEVMGLSIQYLRVLHQQGFFPRGEKHGTYPLGAAVQGYIKYLKDRKPRRDATERSGLVAAQRAKVQLELTRNLGELLPAAMVEDTLQQLSTIYISLLDALPSRMANELASITEPAVVRDRLLGEVRTIRETIATALESRAAALKAMRDVSIDLEPAKEAESLGMGGSEPELPAGERGAGAVSGDANAVLHPDSGSVRQSKVPRGRRGNGNADGEDGVVPKRNGKKAR